MLFNKKKKQKENPNDYALGALVIVGLGYAIGSFFRIFF